MTYQRLAVSSSTALAFARSAVSGRDFPYLGQKLGCGRPGLVTAGREDITPGLAVVEVLGAPAAPRGTHLLVGSILRGGFRRVVCIFDESCHGADRLRIVLPVAPVAAAGMKGFQPGFFGNAEELGPCRGEVCQLCWRQWLTRSGLNPVKCGGAR